MVGEKGGWDLVDDEQALPDVDHAPDAEGPGARGAGAEGWGGREGVQFMVLWFVSASQGAL